MVKMKMLSADETVYFCEQLAAVLNSGIQLSDGMEILAEDMEDERIKQIAVCLADELNNEKTLFEAMETVGVFPPYLLNIVKIGTLTGRLEDVLKELALYYENSSNLTQTIKSAVLHPLILLSMMTAVIIVLIKKIIPMFSDIFTRFDENISDTIQKSINSAYTTGIIILIVLLIIIILAGAIAVISKIPYIKKRLSRMLSQIIFTKNISRIFDTARFANAMSMMVSSGIEPVEALENSISVVSDKDLIKRINDCRERILNGEYFSEAISDSKLIPSIHARSLKIAYKSGSFDLAWKKISKRCSDEAERTINSIISFIEPVLIGLLTVIIGSILLTIMLPLMNIMSSIG